MACPSDSSLCCQTFTLTISGSTGIDGTYVYTSDGSPSWVDAGNAYNSITCLSDVWYATVALDYYNVVIFTVSNTTGCPPESGWTVYQDDYNLYGSGSLSVVGSSCPGGGGGTNNKGNAFFLFF